VKQCYFELRDTSGEAQAAAHSADGAELVLFAMTGGVNVIKLVAHRPDEPVRTDAPRVR
jgi:hypothetical protein